MGILRYAKNKKGITLIEAVIAVLILGLALGALLGSFVVGKIIADKAKHRIIAMNLLRAQMEWVKGQTYNDLLTLVDNPIVEDNVDATIGDDELLNDVRTTTVVQNEDGTLRVTITLNWDKRLWGGILPAGGDDAPSDEELITIIGVP